MSTEIRFFKEPLVHFIALGAALFALHRAVAPPAPSRTIAVTPAVLAGLRQEQARRTGATPAEADVPAILERWIDDEVKYREALALGLDRGDVIVRRRLLQKMDFLLGARTPVAPDDQELSRYKDQHQARYRDSSRRSLVQVFVASERHGERAAAVAGELRARLVAGADPSGLGDPFLGGRELRERTQKELASSCGEPFAEGVFESEVGVWSTPIASPFGLHLVKVTSLTPGRAPPLREVRDAVVRDWLEEKRAAATMSALLELRGRYDVRVEGGAPALAAR